MFRLLGSRKGTNCDGSTRRDFLKIGALGMSGFMLPELLRARALAAAQGKPTKKTSVVWWLIMVAIGLISRPWPFAWRRSTRKAEMPAVLFLTFSAGVVRASKTIKSE